jgi:hypothetical protein
MMQAFDPVCLSAFTRLLARPDPADLPRRAHVYRWQGDPNRRVTRLPGILMAWLQYRHLEHDVEEPIAPARRTWTRRTRAVNPGLQVLVRPGRVELKCSTG